MDLITCVPVNIFKFIFKNNTSIVIIAVMPVVFACCYYWKFRRSFRNLPAYSWEVSLFYLWITGKLPKHIPFTSYFYYCILDFCKQFRNEGLFLLWGVYPWLLIFDEKYIKFFANEPEAVNKAFAYSMLGEMTGQGLLIHNGSHWKNRRKMFNPAFRLEVLKSHIRVVNDGAKDLVQRLKSLNNEPTNDLLDIVKLSTLKILCESVMGVKLTDENSESMLSEYLKLVSSLARYTIYRVSRPWLYWTLPQTLFKAGREHKKLYKEFHHFTEKIILEMKKSYVTRFTEKTDENVEDGYLSGKSFTEILLEKHLQDPSFTMEDLQAEVTTFIFAGHDTTSYTIMWCLFMLGHHPDVQEKAFEEIDSIVGNRTTYNYGDLNRMIYIECIIKETLRLYPTVPMYGRQTSKEIQCGKYKIPKNTNVGFILPILHRNPDVFPEPEKFCPERFYKQSFHHPWSYVPFSEGIRSCIGKKFAMTSLKIILAQIIQNFKIASLDKEEDVAGDWNLILSPTKPIRFQLTNRQSSFSLQK